MINLGYTFRNREDFSAVQFSINQYLEDVLGSQFMLVEVAINEAINNAFDAADQVELTFEADEEKLLINIKDNGEGFDVHDKMLEIETKKEKKMEEMLYSESGRGLYIMNQAVDRIQFNKEGNEVVMIKYRNRQGRENEN